MQRQEYQADSSAINLKSPKAVRKAVCVSYLTIWTISG
jgi:hypothetical protein